MDLQIEPEASADEAAAIRAALQAMTTSAATGRGASHYGARDLSNEVSPERARSWTQAGRLEALGLSRG